VLYLIEFKNKRVGLYQGNELLGASLLNAAAGKRVLLKMDGGEDMGILKWTKPWVLTGGFPEVPFMPVTRYATRMDICLQEKRTEESEKLLVFCKSLLSRHPFNNLNKKFGFRITDVELQVSTSIRSKEERLTKCM